MGCFTFSLCSYLFFTRMNLFISILQGWQFIFWFCFQILLYIHGLNIFDVFQSIAVCCAQSLELCPTLCNSTDHCPTGFSVCGIIPARILEWVAIPYSRRSSQPRDRTYISYIGGQLLYHWATSEVPISLYLSSKEYWEMADKLLFFPSMATFVDLQLVFLRGP